jgi:hypothetical protein
MARKSHRKAAPLLLALALSVSGCEKLSDLGILSGSRTNSEQPAAETGPDLSALTRPPVVDGDNPSIKAKFGVTETEGVTAAFNALHAYIATGGLDDAENVIRRGDWIDLESLTVGAYNGAGEVSNLTDPNLLRLIVVGINSFNSKNGNGTTSHVVFHFQNIPVQRRMNSESTNAGGYRDSEMRKYLLNDKDSNGSAPRISFLTGLKNAGVPEEVLWAPKRIVSVNGAGGSMEISDLLWLPTEREMFVDRNYSVAGDETAGNQAWFGYYDSDAKRKKYDSNGGSYWWEASPYSGSSSFCIVLLNGYASVTGAVSAGGCVPAFCVW